MNPEGTTPTNNTPNTASTANTGPAEVLRQAGIPMVPVSSEPPQKQAPPSSATQNPVIRTYESDVADAIQKKKASVVTMALAESRRSAEAARLTRGAKDSAPAVRYGVGIFKIILILIFLGAGALGSYYLYLKSPLAPPIEKPRASNLVPSIITPDSQTFIDVDGLDEDGLLRAIRKEKAKIIGRGGGMSEIVFVKTETGANGEVKKVVGSGDMLTQAGVLIPDIILRSLGDRWMFGYMSVGDGGNEVNRQMPFIMATNTFFQNAFAGMLRWESDMVDDLAALFEIKPGQATPVTTPPTTSAATSTATSTVASTTPVANATTSVQLTSPPISYFSIRGKFEDTTIRNKDVRRFKDAYGNTLFLYSFIDKEMMLLTTNEATFMAIIDRIEKQTHIR